MDLVNRPKDEWNTFIGRNVAGSEELAEFDNISEHWPVPPNRKAIDVIVEIRRLGKL